MIRYIVITLYLAIVATSSSCNNQQGPVIAPKSTAKAINQIPIEKNGCGPASLINAYRFGSPRWNAATDKIEGKTDKEKFEFMVKYYGRIFSSYARATQRWDDRSGINSLDLTDMANDFQTRRKLRLPKLRHTTHFVKDKENHQKLLISTHKHLRKSLQSGFPPLISIKRFAQRGSRWRPTDTSSSSMRYQARLHQAPHHSRSDTSTRGVAASNKAQLRFPKKHFLQSTTQPRNQASKNHPPSPLIFHSPVLAEI